MPIKAINMPGPAQLHLFRDGTLRRTAFSMALLQTLLFVLLSARGGVILTNLFSFQNLKTGYDPRPRLVLYSNGSFYGTTSGGGTHDLGTVFLATPAGFFTRLVTFDGNNWILT